MVDESPDQCRGERKERGSRGGGPQQDGTFRCFGATYASGPGLNHSTAKPPRPRPTHGNGSRAEEVSFLERPWLTPLAVRPVARAPRRPSPPRCIWPAASCHGGCKRSALPEPTPISGTAVIESVISGPIEDLVQPAGIAQKPARSPTSNAMARFCSSDCTWAPLAPLATTLDLRRGSSSVPAGCTAWCRLNLSE